MQLKDLICTKGVATSCSSRMLEEYVPVYDATVASRLYEQGAVLLGKGNMDEFGMGSSCENSAFFPTRNPWDVERVPGGSSGGGAAAVASGEAVYALGSDTGGSIRQPSAMCGTVGLKPTYGLVSRYGLIAYASSLDQIGPITRDVTDSALVLNAIAGPDPRDSTCLNLQVPDMTSGLGGNSSAPLAVAGDASAIRLGVPEEYFVDGMEAGVREAVQKAIDTLEALGAVVEPRFPAHHPVRSGLLLHNRPIGVFGQPGPVRRCEVRVFVPGHRRHGGRRLEQTRRNGFGPEVKRRIMLGAYALSAGYYDAYYLKSAAGQNSDPPGVSTGIPTG